MINYVIESKWVLCKSFNFTEESVIILWSSDNYSNREKVFCYETIYRSKINNVKGEKSFGTSPNNKQNKTGKNSNLSRW